MPPPAASSSIYEALVDIEHRIVDPGCSRRRGSSPRCPAEGAPLPPREPLLSGRPCPAGRVGTTSGRCRAITRKCRAVRDWVRRQRLLRRSERRPAHASVLDTLRDGVGVCRDFAHAMIADRRVLNYPARIVTSARLRRRCVAGAAGLPRMRRGVHQRNRGTCSIRRGFRPSRGSSADRPPAATPRMSRLATLFGPVARGNAASALPAPIEDPALGIRRYPLATELAVSTTD